MKVTVIGLGYVGLPLACAIARKTKHSVVGYDISEEKIEIIKKRECPIDDEQCEKDLKEISFNCTSNSEQIRGSDIYIVCVPTPVLNDYTPNLEPLKEAVLEISKFLEKGQTVVIESTINPGVCEEIVKPLLEEKTALKAGVDFDIAHCPERINPGDPVWNVYNIPRNVGSTRAEATKMLADFYRGFIDNVINEMPDLKSVEATKIIENTFRDINIAFVNELAKSFDVLGIDLVTVIKGAANKPFAFMPHYPSCGVGGHCIPVDPYFLIERAKKSGFDHKYLKLAREINNSMPFYTIELLANGLNEFEKSIKGTKIALLGMSYKADVGDIRESPSLKIEKLLLKSGASLTVFDPYFPQLSNVSNLKDALKDAFAIVIATDHKEFLNINPEMLANTKVKVIIDGKNCLKKSAFKEAGFYYKGIGH